MPLVRAEKLYFGYERGSDVLRGADLEVERGECFAILGPSGAGKTTLLRLLNLLREPRAGEIRFDFEGGPSDPRDVLHLRRKMALVFQEPTLFNTTVWANVAYGLLVRADPLTRMKERLRRRGELGEQVRSVLQAVGLAGFERRRALSLSAGERRRVALARALVLEPELLLLDEPTVNLDPQNVAVMESLIGQSNTRGATIILATHDIGQAQRLAHRAALLGEGRIAEEGPAGMVKSEVGSGDARLGTRSWWRVGVVT